MTLQDQASQLSKPELIRLLSAIYGIEDHIDDIIDRHLAIGKDEEPGANPVVRVLAFQIEKFRDDDEFIDYRASTGFANRLESVLDDIDDLLGTDDPAAALELTEMFLTLPDTLFERVDDSDGSLGDVFQEAVKQWLLLAEDVRAANPEAESWVEKVLHYFHNNEYGVFDDIIAGSSTLLTDQEFQQLAWRFENEARQAVEASNTSRHNHSGATALHGLQSVAEALSDIHLYETSMLLRSPEPNTLQLDSLIRFALTIGELDRAEHWLEQPQWHNDPRRHRSLRNLWLQQKGQTDQLRRELLDAFQQRPDLYSLEASWLLAGEQDRWQLRQQVEELAEPPDDVYDRVTMLITVNSLDKAAQLLVHYHNELRFYHYTALQIWLRTFEANGNALAMVVCYRALLNDLLDRGFSRAYHHGVRYFHRLLALDNEINDYHGLSDAQSYIRHLQSKHGRKWSFWKEADYPAKPEQP